MFIVSTNVAHIANSDSLLFNNGESIISNQIKITPFKILDDSYVKDK